MNFADIIIMALIAGFVAMRLRNTLGKKSGFDNFETYAKPKLPTEKRQEEIVAPIKATVKTDDSSSKQDDDYTDINVKFVGTLDSIKKISADFTVKNFLKGAKKAFELILHSFNQGDKENLEFLLSKTLYQKMSEEIDDARNQDETIETSLVGINKVEISDVKLQGNVAKITVDFVSEQISVTKNKQGEILKDKLSDVDMIKDKWVFEQNIKYSNKPWKVILMK